MRITNIAFYHFFEVQGVLDHVRIDIKHLCYKLGLKGTILIAREGINVMVAGESKSIEKFKTFLRELTGKEDLFFKESYSDEIPFNRMLVKAKSQLIPVDDPSIKPAKKTAPRLSPEKLKEWLDQDKDVVLLDTRNEFEVTIGSFENAKQFNIHNFRDFEYKLAKAPEEWKDKPVIAFCTGGIRCEKATPLMMKHGFQEVYQLEGGILNYFEKTNGAHWKGDCFVFDRRVALKQDLKESEVVECFNCRHPVTPEEQKLPSYQYEISCPYCYSEALKS